MLGLLVGRQWVQYVATELALEWLHSYGGSKTGWFSSQLNEADLSFYTVGVGLDCMPMVPVSDSISLLGVFGMGYKKANIKCKKEEIFDWMESHSKNRSRGSFTWNTSTYLTKTFGRI